MMFEIDSSMEAALAALPELARKICESGIRSTRDLMNVEEYLDAVDSGLVAASATYVRLCQQAEQYLREHWDLSQPWVRPGGAVHDMLTSLQAAFDTPPSAAPAQPRRWSAALH